MKKIIYSLPLFILTLCFLSILFFSSCSRQHYSLRTIKGNSDKIKFDQVNANKTPFKTIAPDSDNTVLHKENSIVRNEQVIDAAISSVLNENKPEKQSFIERKVQKILAKKINKLISSSDIIDAPANSYQKGKIQVEAPNAKKYTVSKQMLSPTINTPSNHQLLTILLVILVVLLILLLLPALFTLVLLCILVLLVLLLLGLLGIIKM